jgi:hypothetical protein
LQTQLVEVVKAISPSTVQLRCGQALGSGVVYDGQGDVVTNAHRVMGEAVQNDVAVVRVSGATPPAATFGDSSKVQVGQLVLAMLVCRRSGPAPPRMVSAAAPAGAAGPELQGGGEGRAARRVAQSVAPRGS